jgi:hypothetical protein
MTLAEGVKTIVTWCKDLNCFRRVALFWHKLSVDTITTYRRHKRNGSSRRTSCCSWYCRFETQINSNNVHATKFTDFIFTYEIDLWLCWTLTWAGFLKCHSICCLREYSFYSFVP